MVHIVPWLPLTEWEPKLNERVVDHRRETLGALGHVIACDRYGHAGDPYWRATVGWDYGTVEHDIETSWLTREDATQGPRR
jgi:hypothetical protein